MRRKINEDDEEKEDEDIFTAITHPTNNTTRVQTLYMTERKRVESKPLHLEPASQLNNNLFQLFIIFSGLTSMIA